jgi:hypothetical protein
MICYGLAHHFQIVTVFCVFGEGAICVDKRWGSLEVKSSITDALLRVAVVLGLQWCEHAAVAVVRRVLHHGAR